MTVYLLNTTIAPSEGIWDVRKITNIDAIDLATDPIALERGEIKLRHNPEEKHNGNWLHRSRNEVLDSICDITGRVLMLGHVVSHIGHESTAALVGELLGCPVGVNPEPCSPVTGDVLLCLKLNDRPPEGVILDREAIEAMGYQWYTMVLVHTNAHCMVDLALKEQAAGHTEAAWGSIWDEARW